MLEAMAVDRPDIPESQLFEEQPGQDNTLGQFFGSMGEPAQGISQAGNGFQQLLRLFADARDEFPGVGAIEVRRQRADIRRDRHLIVVEDDQ